MVALLIMSNTWEDLFAETQPRPRWADGYLFTQVLRLTQGSNGNINGLKGGINNQLRAACKTSSKRVIILYNWHFAALKWVVPKLRWNKEAWTACVCVHGCACVHTSVRRLRPRTAPLRAALRSWCQRVSPCQVRLGTHSTAIFFFPTHHTHSHTGTQCYHIKS